MDKDLRTFSSTTKPAIQKLNLSALTVSLYLTTIELSKSVNSYGIYFTRNNGAGQSVKQDVSVDNQVLFGRIEGKKT